VEIINGIVAMQQAYAGRFGTMETLAITELVESALRLQANTYEHRSIDIARDFATVPAVLTDKHSVLVILVNLLQNAQQACEAARPLRKQITIRVQRAGDAAVSITVADNGVGIAPENMVRIFEHGFTTRNDGHGFGLHSGALAAREIGGQLTVHSDGLGTGAAFTLTLPLRPPPKSESGNPPARPAPDVSSGE
jgi:signal transduction histidine kinase